MANGPIFRKWFKMNTVISIVIDDQPKFLMQAWNLVCSLMNTGDWPSANVSLIIHHTKAVNPRRLQLFSGLGAKLVQIEPWGNGQAVYCNKLRQLETPEVLNADLVFLLDTDVIIAKPLSTLATSAEIRGSIVDLPNPPYELWISLLSKTPFGGVELFSAVPNFSPNSVTLKANFNGGVYVLPKARLAILKNLWPKWTNFCLSHSDMLRDKTVHSDQMGFALAVLEADFDVDPLSVSENFPLHFDPETYQIIEPCELSIIHYHSCMDSHGLPKNVQVDWIDEQIRLVTEKIINRRREIFDNAIFWDFRYQTYPELGSGVGSRGGVLDYKRSTLQPYFQEFANKRVIDVGCGDLETTRGAPFTNYTGIDLSESALKIAKTKRPDWSFSDAPLTEYEDCCADLVLCLDVLIHQPNSDDAQSLIDQLVRISNTAIIASGHQGEVDENGIVFGHPPILDILNAHPDVDQAFEIGSYRGLSLALALKKRGEIKNINDISDDNLSWALSNSTSPQLLNDMVSLSRKHLSFFPQTIIRCFEYPWVASKLLNSFGKRVLDLGAGVSVLPLWLAENGLNVVTIDYHNLIRKLDNRLSWNEWGFLDFSLLDDRIVSINQDMTSFSDDLGFDVIYSVSVIEHMPADARRSMISRLKQLLRPDGRIILTLDLIPGSDSLWPFSEGKLVEEQGVHGELSDIIRELENTGLEVFELTTMRSIPDSRTDIAMLDLRQNTNTQFRTKSGTPSYLTKANQKKLLLHIGLPKTGTSGLQDFLSKNRQPLAELGVNYPEDKIRYGSVGLDRKHQSLVDALFAKNMSGIESYFGNEDFSTTFLSAEGLSHHFHDFGSEALSAFRKATAEYQVELFFVKRDLRNWLWSMYKQCLINPTNENFLYGTSLDFESFCDTSRMQMLMDHDGLIEAARSGYGAAKVHIGQFESHWQPSLELCLGFSLSNNFTHVKNINLSLADEFVSQIRNINANAQNESERLLNLVEFELEHGTKNETLIMYTEQAKAISNDPAGLT
jgi:2-polyprenyl-3-methyl-5-hydroxy-6-metoxy-1,4-benzoquinol methylase